MSCPHCGGGQEESAQALSTICRHCGRYFKLEGARPEKASFRFANLFKRRNRDKGGGYLKPSLGVDDRPRERPALRRGSRTEPFYGAEEYVPGVEGENVLDPAAAELAEELRQAERAAERELLDRLEEEDEMGSGYEMVEIADPGPAGPGEDPLKHSLTPTFPGRVTRCFDCGATLQIRGKPAATVCGWCSAPISLEDVEVRDHRREILKIRGDLTIHQDASLSAAEIACETLRVYGKITGKIDCHGDAFFRSSGKVVGSVRCRHLFVHRSADLIFIPGIRAETAEIHGRMAGDLICEGTIRISKTGVVLGHCTAPAIELESGGILSGQMRIAKPDEKVREDFERKAEVARSEFLMRGIEEFERSARRPDANSPEPAVPEGESSP